MKITLYGHPYHLYEHVWLNSNNILELYNKYNDNIVNYIDGVFGIVIETEACSKVITDYYGYYPLFYNTSNRKVYKDIDINDIEYLDIKYNNYINSNIYNLSHNILTDDSNNYKYLINYNRTVFSNFRLLPPRSITNIYKNNIKSKRYDLNNIKHIENINVIDYYNTLITNLINNSNKKYIVNPMTAGYDCRNIYYYLKANNIKSTMFTYLPDINTVKRIFKNEDIDYFNIDYSDISFIDYIDTKISTLNGLSDIYYYHGQYLSIDKYLNKDVLFITSDGANDYLDGRDSIISLYNIYTGYGHFTKLYDVCQFLPIYCNKYIVSNINDRKEFMNSLSKHYTDKEQKYYEGITQTRWFYKYYNKNNFNSKTVYYNKYCEYIKNKTGINYEVK